MKMNMRSCENDFNAAGISDAVVGMEKTSNPAGKKLFPKANPEGKS
jgi:hypothetical protein